MFFSFPDDARWNPDRQAIEFGVGIGEYEGLIRVPRQAFRRFIDGAVTPERCVEAYYLHRTRFERLAERKLRDRQLTDDANVEITGRDLHAAVAATTHPAADEPGRPICIAPADRGMLTRRGERV